MKRVKVILFTALVILTITVVAFDLRFFNPPKVWCIYILGHGFHPEHEEESWTVVDITNHPLRKEVLWYINRSISRSNKYGTGATVYIINDPEVRDFFSKYYVSTGCGTCLWELSPYMKDGDTYYKVIVGYSNVSLSLLEYVIAWAASIATSVLWIFTFLSIRKPKGQKEMKNV